MATPQMEALLHLITAPRGDGEEERLDVNAVLQLAALVNDSMQAKPLQGVTKYLGDCLKSKDFRTTMVALDTLEMLMDNCYTHFHLTVCHNGSILKPMRALAEAQKKKAPKREEEVMASRALALVRAWAEGFLMSDASRDKAGKEIVSLYRDLQKKKWVRWPPEDGTMKFDPRPKSHRTPPSIPARLVIGAPSFSANASSRQQENAAHQEGEEDFDRGYSSTPPTPPRKPLSLRSSSLRTFTSAETQAFRGDVDSFDATIKLFEDILDKSVDARATVRDNQDLYDACRGMGPQIITMIQVISERDPNAPMDPLLELNDRLTRVMGRFEAMSRATVVEKVNGGVGRNGQDFSSSSRGGIQKQKQLGAMGRKSTNPFDDPEIVQDLFGPSSVTKTNGRSYASTTTVPMFSSNPASTFKNSFYSPTFDDEDEDEKLL